MGIEGLVAFKNSLWPWGFPVALFVLRRQRVAGRSCRLVVDPADLFRKSVYGYRWVPLYQFRRLLGREIHRRTEAMELSLSFVSFDLFCSGRK